MAIWTCTNCSRRFGSYKEYRDHETHCRSNEEPRYPVTDGGTLLSCDVCGMPIHGSPYRFESSVFHQSCRPDILPNPGELR